MNVLHFYGIEAYAVRTFGFIVNTSERRFFCRRQALETFLNIRTQKALPA